ncbi:MAG: FAD:protein FMN transferase, partial [Actinomycetota bacterium]
MTTVASTPEVSVVEHGFRAMNTEHHLLIVGGTQELAAQAEQTVHRCEQRWSRFLADSELTRLNDASGRPVIVAPETYDLIDAAVEAFHQTDGVFDPTVLRCMVDAGYTRSFELIGGAPGPTPTGVRPAPTPSGIEFFPAIHAIRLPPDVGLDLGGIAKGATADLVAEELLMSGADGCCVNVGGDVAVRGRGPVDGGWHVQLECPGADERRAVHLAEGAVCTSTILKRQWGRSHRQHHLRFRMVEVHTAPSARWTARRSSAPGHSSWTCH